MPVTVKQTLTGPQFASITDFTQLFLRFTANLGGNRAQAVGVGAAAAIATGLFLAQTAAVGTGASAFLGLGKTNSIGAAVGTGAAAATAASTYLGAGDALSGAYLWGGLRAYTAAGIGANAIILRRDGDNATASFVTIAGGGLDTASIATFLAGGSPPSSNLYCTQLYDQTGNGHHPAQATAANQPLYSSTSGPGGKPGLTFNLGQWLIAPVSVTATCSYSFVAKTNPDGVHDLGLGGDALNISAGIILQRGVSVSQPNTIALYAGNAFATVFSVTDNTWQAFNAVNNTSTGNGTMEANGVQATSAVNFGSAPIMTSFYVGQDGSRYWRGLICETAIWLGGTTTTIDTVNGNQRTYWAF